MYPEQTIQIVAFLSIAGVLASVFISLKLWRVYKIVRDKSLLLMSFGLLVYGIALFLESIGNLYLGHFASSLHSRRPVEITTLIIHRGSMLSLPLYMISYVLFAVSHYVGSLDVSSSGSRSYILLPVIVLMYLDMNVLSLLVLIIAAYAVLVEYGRASYPTLLFYLLIGLSHLIPLLVFTSGGLAWWTVPLSTSLRGLAPLTLLIISTVKRG